MADFTADFEAGTNGNSVTTAGGEASATAWGDAVNFTYDNTHAHGGTLAGKSTTGSTCDLLWAMSGAVEHYGRFYFYTGANPSGDYRRIFEISRSGGTQKAEIWLDTSGKVYIADNGDAHSQVSTNSIALNQWVRFEYHLISSATVGQIEVKFFNSPESATPTETITSPASWDTGTGSDWCGPSTQPEIATSWFDDIVANATSYPGPVAAAAGIYTVLNGSDEALSNVNAAGTGIDAASYKDAVSLTEEELATLLDGSSFGKKNVAVLPNLTGVADARQIKKTTFSAETESA